MLKIKVVNCDGIVVGYEWNSITDFIAAVNSDSEVILMLDDELSDVVTDNNRLNNWWKHHNRAVICHYRQKWRDTQNMCSCVKSRWI